MHNCEIEMQTKLVKETNTYLNEVQCYYKP
jgi:hypothetical protein